jgi:hypothetical protein
VPGGTGAGAIEEADHVGDGLMSEVETDDARLAFGVTGLSNAGQQQQLKDSNENTVAFGALALI